MGRFRDRTRPQRHAGVGNYSPADNAALDAQDLDLGSTSPVLLGTGVLAQGGKDAIIRLLGAGAISGAAPHTGGELQYRVHAFAQHAVHSPGGLAGPGGDLDVRRR